MTYDLAISVIFEQCIFKWDDWYEFDIFHQVLMLIDASFGFEMETFEFLNICQVHGFPRIMGVLTHLDSFKNNKTLRKTKKNLKHRFWTEVYQVKLGSNDMFMAKLIMVSNEIFSMLFLN